jgi:type VII secretion-associated serine protease mycosin
MDLALVAPRRQNERAVRLLIDRFRSAFIATCLAALTAIGAGLVATPARADWVRNDQWQLGALNAVAAWQHSTGRGIVVAVLDSGVDANHPDLAGQVLPGYDLVDGSSDGRVDPVGHGTTVAALIAGRRDEDGVVGLAPDAKILPVRVLDSHNRYEDASIVARGLRWAVDNGATVVNLSLGGLAHSDVLADAVAYAAAKDVVVIACTGNLAQTAEGAPQVWYPAREPGVVAVTGLRGLAGSPGAAGWLDKQAAGESAGDELWSGSLTGPETVLSAPAVNLIGARPGGYWRVQGTSFAAPLVTGAAALVRSRHPGLSAANVINRLIGTAADLGAPGRDNRYGFGLVDPLAAITAEMADVQENPLLAAQRLSQPAAGTDHTGGSGAPDGLGPAGSGNPATDPSGAPGDETTASADPQRHRRAGAFAYAGGAGAPLAIALLLIAAVIASLGGRREYLKRYVRRARHSR